MKLSEQTKSVSHEDALRGRRWILIDAEGRSLGRVASRAASVLRGKHRPDYTPHQDAGDFVIVINAAKVKVTGKKATDKKYYRHALAGFPGGLKIENYETLQRRHPEDIIVNAVRRMLPRNALGRQMMTKLRVYADDKHPHGAQKPVAKQVEA